jgi:hypothetical protein
VLTVKTLKEIQRDSCIWTKNRRNRNRNNKQKTPWVLSANVKNLSAKRVTASVFKRRGSVLICANVSIVKMIKFPASAVRNKNRHHLGFRQLIRKSNQSNKTTAVGPNLKLPPYKIENLKHRLPHRRKEQQRISK